MERFGYEVFKDYEKGDYIYKHKFCALTDYIVGNVIADYSPNRGFYWQWQHESSNLYIVARWRKNNDKPRKAKYGERVCYTRLNSEGEIIDLTDEQNKDHCKYCYRCSRLEV